MMTTLRSFWSLVFFLSTVVLVGCGPVYPKLSSIEKSMSENSLSTSNRGEKTRVNSEITTLSFAKSEETYAKPLFENLDQNANIMEYVRDAPGVVLLDFHAEWCGPCKKQSAVLENLKPLAKQKRASVIKIDVDQHRELAGHFMVYGLPTLIVIKDGEIVDRQLGFANADKVTELLSK